MSIRLHVNVDHVATIRNARGTRYPDPVRAAVLCELAGAHGITVHLREDRRHIVDRDVKVLRETVATFLNLEMAATDPMIDFAIAISPDLVTLVPERREERTTEGGLDVAGQKDAMRRAVERLGAAGIPVSLFIDPDDKQVDASIGVEAHAIELHTGDYANALHDPSQIERLVRAGARARKAAPKMIVAAGHGLTTANVVALVARVKEVSELNIGHALVADAVMIGLNAAVRGFLAAIAEGERAR